MIDRLHDVLPYLEQLPPEAQEEAAGYVEALDTQRRSCH